MTTTARIPKEDFALRMRNVSVTLGGVQILSNVTAQPAVGVLNAIIGPNGAGKTTLLRAIMGIIPYSGTIQLGETADGEPLRIGYVPQRLDFDRGMPVTVIDFLCSGLQRSPIWLGHSGGARRIAARQLA